MSTAEVVRKPRAPRKPRDREAIRARREYQPPEGERVPREEYGLYIKSSAWRKKRHWFAAETKASACEGCGRPWSIKSGGQVHHRTYDRLGHEELWDLAAVCRSCHKRIHDTLSSWRCLEKHTYRVLAQIRAECSKSPA